MADVANKPAVSRSRKVRRESSATAFFSALAKRSASIVATPGVSQW
jgi:hypothetical protein